MIELLKTILDYNPKTGVFTWRMDVGARAKTGNIAGSRTPQGYILIRVLKQRFFAHRLAWAFHYGQWPLNQIDHENRIKWDNRIKNLREATHALNNANRPVQSNNQSGFKGARYQARTGKYESQISYRGKTYCLGTYNTAQEANLAYEKKAKELFAEFGCGQ